MDIQFKLGYNLLLKRDGGCFAVTSLMLIV